MTYDMMYTLKHGEDYRITQIDGTRSNEFTMSGGYSEPFTLQLRTDSKVDLRICIIATDQRNYDGTTIKLISPPYVCHGLRVSAGFEETSWEEDYQIKKDLIKERTSKGAF